jgi:hypothetical protein
MRSRPVLSLAAHLNGQTWAMQLGGALPSQRPQTGNRTTNSASRNVHFSDDAA